MTVRTHQEQTMTEQTHDVQSQTAIDLVHQLLHEVAGTDWTKVNHLTIDPTPDGGLDITAVVVTGPATQPHHPRPSEQHRYLVTPPTPVHEHRLGSVCQACALDEAEAEAGQ